mgnify:CR=1 FL=1
MTSPTITEMQERKLLTTVQEKIQSVNWENVFFGTIGTTATLSFGFYTYIFAISGGWWWAWAIPYAALTLFAGGFTVYCFANMFTTKSALGY